LSPICAQPGFGRKAKVRGQGRKRALQNTALDARKRSGGNHHLTTKYRVHYGERSPPIDKEQRRAASALDRHFFARLTNIGDPGWGCVDIEDLWPKNKPTKSGQLDRPLIGQTKPQDLAKKHAALGEIVPRSSLQRFFWFARVHAISALDQGFPRTYIACQGRIASDAVCKRQETDKFRRKPEPNCVSSASSSSMVFARAARDAVS
jgi:hypothetical protein